MNIAVKRKQRGHSVILWIITLPVLLAFGVFAVDLNNYFLALSELQVAADAAALAGVQEFYTRDPTSSESDMLNATSAFDRAKAIAQANKVRGTAIADADITIEARHWEFSASGMDVCDEPGRNCTFNERDDFAGTRFLRNLQFPTNNDDEFILLITDDDNSTDLNRNGKFLNAFQVTLTGTSRSFFGSFINRSGDFRATAEAVAYVGFAGRVDHMTAPLALCRSAIEEVNSNGDNVFTCNNLGSAPSPTDLRWTSYQESTPTQADVKRLIKDMQCSVDDALATGETVTIGDTIEVESLTNISGALTKLSECKDKDDNPSANWPLTLPVIDCNNNNRVLGFISVNVTNIDVSSNTITLDSTCNVVSVPGKPGGVYNFGVLASEPVLVK